MTNREKLRNSNIFDVLVEKNKVMNKGYKCYMCIMEIMQDRQIYTEDHRRCVGQATPIHCGECISRWLNEESEG